MKKRKEHKTKRVMSLQEFVGNTEEAEGEHKDQEDDEIHCVFSWEDDKEAALYAGAAPPEIPHNNMGIDEIELPSSNKRYASMYVELCLE